MRNKGKKTHWSKSMVLMMKPRVGLTVEISSFMIFLTMVVLPALSIPLRKQVSVRGFIRTDTNNCKVLTATHSMRTLSSLSFRRAFRRIDSILLNVLLSLCAVEERTGHVSVDERSGLPEVSNE